MLFCAFVDLKTSKRVLHFREEVLSKSRKLVRAAAEVKVDEEPAVDIVSYGIGHFATTAASMYQLCLLVELNRNCAFFYCAFDA